jgi:hypothetical protein
MAQSRVTNLSLGLPRQVNVNDPAELRRVMQRILEILHTWNGDVGQPGERLVTAREIEE